MLWFSLFQNGKVLMQSDIEISRQAHLLPITRIAEKLGLLATEMDFFGEVKAKVKLSVNPRLASASKGKLIIVTAVTPTPFGEGKTVTSIGLTQSLNAIGKKVCASIRQPSMGPVFGVKGGAAGGGYAQVVPMEDLNLHLTGDIHAITSAHNLAAAALDARLFHETKLGSYEFEKQSGLTPLNIDKNKIHWRRAIDQNERSLRSITVGLGENNGPIHDSGFDITAASELMAILTLSKDLADMRRRIGNIVLTLNTSGQAITAENLGVAGAMSAIMLDTIKPTLMQTLSGAPCLIHGGPFANIAHGNSSIIADEIALKLADYVVTEAGFGSDMGFEKFANIKVRYSNTPPSAVVLVATLRALKANSDLYSDEDINTPNTERLNAGFANIKWHIENTLQYGAPVVVAINRFPTDTEEELNWLKTKIMTTGVFGCEISDAFAQGETGAIALAQTVVAAAEKPSTFKLLYEAKQPLASKISELAKKAYGAKGVCLSAKAESDIIELTELGYDNLPLCFAKTAMSISHDPNVKGAPTDFTVPISGLKLNAGAGFITVLAGSVMTMPGLGIKPAYLNIDIDKEGHICGLM